MYQTEQKPKLAYFVTMFPRLSETFILNEILALEEKGFLLHIFTRKPLAAFPMHEDFYAVKSPVYLLSVSRPKDWLPAFRDNLFIFCMQPKKYFKTFLYARKKKQRTVWLKFYIAGRTARWIRKKKIEHIHAHFAADNAKIVYMASKISGVGFSFTAHAKDIWVKSSPDSLRGLIKAAAFVVTICKYNQNYLSGLTDNPDKIHLIYNGLDLIKYRKERGKQKSKSNLCRILAVGRLVPKKGFDILINACFLLKEKGLDFSCAIVGEGELMPELKKQINCLGLKEKCFLPGPFSQEMLIRNIYSSAEMLVMPSRTAPDGDRDGIPTVILESLCMEIPVIATPVGGIPEVIIDQKTGLLVSEESETQLAQAIEFLHRDIKTAERLSQAGVNLIVEKFDRNKNVMQLIDLFRRIKK